LSADPRRISFGMKPPAGRSKFGNTLTLRHGIKFHSKKEANRYDQLLLLEKNGEVRNIRRQVRYDFRINGVLIGWYVTDFVYEERTKAVWGEVVEDVKGYPGPTWPMKRKLMKAIHNITVRVT
jgi:hypothetical protein